MKKTQKKYISYVRHVIQVFFLFFFVMLVLGNVCTLKFGEISVSCPLGALQIILSSRTLIVGIVLSAAIFIILTILFGRVFCSWMCPIGTIIEFFEIGLKKLNFIPFFEKAKYSRSLTLVRSKLNRYLVLAATPILAIIFRSPVYCAFCPIGTICRVFHGVCPLRVGLETAFIPAAGALSLGEKRFWCKYLCPVGALLTVISKINPFIKPKFNKEGCINCELCKKICPQSIDITKDVSLAECTKCLECYIKCPTNCIEIKLFPTTIKRKKVMVS